MTRFPDGFKLYCKKRPLLQPVIVFLILTSLLLAACGAQIGNGNWPGLAADDKAVYIAYGPGILAYDPANNEQLWSYPPEASARVQFFASPSVNDGQIVMGDYGAAGGFLSPSVRVTIYALEDTGDGQVRPNWSTDAVASDRIIAPPLQVGDRVFVGTADNYVLALDAASGQLLWRFETGHSIWAQPAFSDDVLFVASLDRTIYALDAATGEELWRAQLGGAIAGEPIVGEELVYASSFDKDVHALDKATGEERWTAPAEDWVWAAPALSDGTLYYADIDGNVYAVDADSGEFRWSHAIDGLVRATPLVANGVVYIASAGDSGADDGTRRGALSALSAATGEELWRQTTPAPVFATPVLIGEAIIVAIQSQEALLLVYDQDDGSQRWRFTPTAEES